MRELYRPFLYISGGVAFLAKWPAKDRQYRLAIRGQGMDVFIHIENNVNRNAISLFIHYRDWASNVLVFHCFGLLKLSLGVGLDLPKVLM